MTWIFTIPVLLISLNACSTSEWGNSPSNRSSESYTPASRGLFAAPDEDSPLYSPYQNYLDNRESHFRNNRDAIEERSKEIYNGTDPQRRRSADLQAAREVH